MSARAAARQVIFLLRTAPGMRARRGEVADKRREAGTEGVSAVPVDGNGRFHPRDLCKVNRAQSGYHDHFP